MKKYGYGALFFTCMIIGGLSPLPMVMYPIFRAYESFLIVFIVTLPITAMTFKIIFNVLNIARSRYNGPDEHLSVESIKQINYMLAAITAVPLVISMTFLLNAKLDGSPYEVHKVTVTEKIKEYRKSRYSSGHYYDYAIMPVFTVSPLSAIKLDTIIPLHIDEIEKISIEHDEYDNLKVGISQMNVRVKKGFFGIAYEDGYNLVFEKTKPEDDFQIGESLFF